MKILKRLKISSDGSISFFQSGKNAYASNKLVVFEKQDDKNFIFNQKVKKAAIDSKQSTFYKKKYLK